MLRQKNNLCWQCYNLWGSDNIVNKANYVIICPKCGSTNIISHNELSSLNIAHIDCDCFFAAVEKRDNNNIIDKPVVVGGGKRGVVAAACYIARIYGIKSAMPMFKALKACPDLVVIKPNMKKYQQAGLAIRKIMNDITPLVEPISIDEAFLDLSGTQRLHGATAAQILIKTIKRIESEVGISASVGLSHNKFLAKIASDLDKPKGFSIIGVNETLDFLENKPVSIIWGVGKVLTKRLASNGINTISELRLIDNLTLINDYGSMGQHLYDYSRGIDKRKVKNKNITKSISSETTFNEDIGDYDQLCKKIWPLCEKISKNMKQESYSGKVISIKLKMSNFQQITRSSTLINPTQLAENIYQTAKILVRKVSYDNNYAVKYRLIGVSVSDLEYSKGQSEIFDLSDPDAMHRAKIEYTIDDICNKLGANAVIKGRVI